MNKIEFKLLTEKGYLIIPNSSESTPRDEIMANLLCIELARGYNIILTTKRDLSKITEGVVIQIFDWLKKEGLLKTQPFYPDRILPASPKSIKDLLNKNKKAFSCKVRTQSNFMTEIINNKHPEELELFWISEVLEGSNSLLFKFLSKHLVRGRINAKRSDRKAFMALLEGLVDQKTQPKEFINYWKKIALWIHPSDFSFKYPKASQYLFTILQELKKKQLPEKPKLKKLMWKGWKKGNEFDVFESFLDDPELTVRDVLISIRDFERDPRVSRWKKTCGDTIMVGKPDPDPGEQEIIELIQLQLKEKLIKLVKQRKEKMCIIPQYFYDISVSELLDPAGLKNMFKEIINYSTISRIFLSKDCRLTLYLLSGRVENFMSLQEINISSYFNESFIIVGYSSHGWKDENLTVTIEDRSQKKEQTILISEEVNSLILFEYDHDTRVFRWIGKPSKTFYAGSPCFITDWGKVKEVLDRDPVMSVGELAENMYTKTDEGVLPSFKEDLGL